jgi:hypothetical protein
MSHFENNFLLLYEINYTNLGTDYNTFANIHLRYIYDLDKEILSDDIDDYITYLFPNCQNCNSEFIREMFNLNSSCIYHGQSNTYLVFSYICRKPFNENCPDKDIYDTYIYNKSNNTMRKFPDDFNWHSTKGFDSRPTRSADFINDSTFVYQSLKFNSYDESGETGYYILTIRN